MLFNNSHSLGEILPENHRESKKIHTHTVDRENYTFSCHRGAVRHSTLAYIPFCIQTATRTYLFKQDGTMASRSTFSITDMGVRT